MQPELPIPLEITFLGTGTSQGVPVIACPCEVCQSEHPYDKRLRSSLLISSGGKNIVIDAGPDFRQQMLVNNVLTLRAILLTHEHADHIFGLDDIRSYNWLQQQPMDIYAEERVHQELKRIFQYVFAQYKYPGIPEMVMHQIDSTQFYIDEIPVMPIRCFHYKLPVLGFRVGGLTYITDTNFISSTEAEKVKGTEILIINALRKEKHISHFNLEEAINFARLVNPSRTYFTHISHSMGKYLEVQPALPENMFLAYDGLKIVIPSLLAIGAVIP
jgi:phosphoribosyl 1,2-cyclic phosphate phosphodiesterase